MDEVSKPKVFGIGLSRTATQSLAVALKRVGWRTIHYPRNVVEIDAYDASFDITVARRFVYLDLVFPGAKFIYTIRDMESWLASCERHFCAQTWRSQPFSEWSGTQRDTGDNDFAAYGAVGFDRDQFISAYHWHDEQVRSHFARRDNLLILDVINTDDSQLWEDLCEFLNVPSIFGPFPWENKSQ